MADGSGACPTCSNELISGAPFCHQCGTAITPGPVVIPAAPAPGPPAPDKLTVVLDDLGDDPLGPSAGSGPVGAWATGDQPPVARVPRPPTTPGVGFAAASVPAGGATAPTAPMVVTAAALPGGGAPVEPARATSPNGRPRPTVLALAIIVVIVLAASAAGAMVLTRGSGGADHAAGSGGESSGGSSASGDGGSGGSNSGAGSSGSDGSDGGESGVTGGGSDDDAFCAKVDEIEAELRAQAASFDDVPEDDPFSGLLLLLTTLGDLGVYMNELADVAPDEIRADMEVVAESFQQEATTDPMEILAGIVTNLSHANSFTRVDAYANEHCGVTLFGPAPTT